MITEGNGRIVFSRNGHNGKEVAIKEEETDPRLFLDIIKRLTEKDSLVAFVPKEEYDELMRKEGVE